MITNVSFALVILSAILHPLWNMLLKQSEDKVVFYFNIHLVYTVLFCFILFFYPVRSVTFSGWALVLFSALAHFFYQLFLCKTYEISDLSLMYPVIRSAPLFVIIMGIFFLREVPSAGALAGIILVVVGVQILNQKGLGMADFLSPFQHVNKKALTFAVLTAFSSACYSVVDKKGALAMDPVLFFYLFFALSGLFFLVYLLFFQEKRKRCLEVLNREKVRITLAAFLEFISYILILYAFRMSKVAYITALRQISVVFGALYGIRFLKESHGKVRLAGSLIIFAGIFLITVFG